MESESLMERKALECEITQGMEQVKQLRASPSRNQESALKRMLASYEEALSILKEIASDGQGQSVVSPSSDTPGASMSVCGGSNKSQRRMVLRTRLIKVTSNQLDDGYIWRKYGQKYILGSQHPRGYYRCAYRASHGCWATKHVRRLDDDPSEFEVTYRGEHTCIGQAYVGARQRDAPLLLDEMDSDKDN